MVPDRHARLSATRLYLVSGARPGGRALAEVLRPALRGGVDLFQLREKDADDEAVLAAAREARALCDEAGALFILNDRPDLVAACEADGVHVGQDDAPASLARRILGPGAVVGLSTHAPAELDAAASEPADYVSVGPVSATPTKPGRAGTGLEYLRYAARTTTRPWFVTGGVTPETLPAMLDAGARRFVVVRWLTESTDPEGAARALRTAIDRALVDSPPLKG